MVSRLPVIDENGEAGDLSQVDHESFRALEEMPLSLQDKLRGRPKAAVTKEERITIRLSPEVLQSFRATGKGWQTRVNTALKNWLTTHNPDGGMRD